MADETTAPKIVDIVAPAITKHTTTPIAEAKSITVETEAHAPSVQPVSNVGSSVAPSTDAQPTTTQPEVPPAEPSVPAVEVSEEPASEPAEVASSTVQTSPYEASDSLPDLSQKMTTELTNEMQSPRIYDTKEYNVPIKDTLHSHGTLGKIIAGVVSALIVVGAVIAAAYFLV